MSIMEHHCNLIPWQQVCRAAGASLVYLRPDEQGVITPQEIEGKIGPRTRIVSITHVSNVLGVTNPVRAIADRAHAMGALVVVDGAQSVPHMQVDVSELGCDLFAFSAHKLMGPLGVGVLWGRREVLESMPPFLTGGEMIDSVSEQDAVWAPLPEKFEAGTQDAAGIYALGAALDYVEGIGYEAIERRERELVRYLYESLAALPYLELIGPSDPARHVGARLVQRARHPPPRRGEPARHARRVRARRPSLRAAPPELDGPADVQPRVRSHVYNDAADVDKLVDGLRFVWSVFHGND